MLSFSLIFSLVLPGCISCNNEVARGIYNSTFFPNLLMTLSAFIALGIIVTILTAISKRHHNDGLLSDPNILDKGPLMSTSMILGIGLGGLADGVILHQILQWHQMLSNKIPATNSTGKSINMFWDGIFHGFCVIIIFIGIVRLWKLLGRTEINKSGKLLISGLISGWAVFNLVEGLIDHHIFKLHNVMEVSRNPNIGNLSFLVVSVIMLIGGFLIYRKA